MRNFCGLQRMNCYQNCIKYFQILYFIFFNLFSSKQKALNENKRTDIEFRYVNEIEIK